MASQTALRRTPSLLLGPYYPLGASDAAGSSLFRGTTPSGTRRLRLEGHVQRLDGTPLPDVRIELWHADPAGRYPHPSAGDAAAVLEGFTGYGTTRSDATGRFVFTSVVPGGYRDGPTARAPHLHLQLSGRADRLVTQLFLPGDARNDADRWYRAVRDSERLLPTVVRDHAESLDLHWTACVGWA